MTLPLKNHFTLQDLMFYLLMFLIGLFVFTKCQNDSEFRVEHSARMPSWGFNSGDTTYGESKDSKWMDVKYTGSDWVSRTIYFKNGIVVGVNFQDTTKPKPKVINHNYSLVGTDTLFNILWLQINSPADVTPRQTNTIKEWIQKNLKPDTTHQK